MEEFMSLPAEVRILYFVLLILSDTEGRLIKTTTFIFRNYGYSDFSSPEDIDKALSMLEENGLIYVYDYSEGGCTVQLIQIVDYHVTQAGKAYEYDSSRFPPPEGYEVIPPQNRIRSESVKDKRFIAFYNSYPKKHKKASAADIWAKMNPTDEDYSTIMAGLAKWIPYWIDKTDDIPDPDVFLVNRLFMTKPSAKNQIVENSDSTAVVLNSEGYPSEYPF